MEDEREEKKGHDERETKKEDLAGNITIIGTIITTGT